MPMKKCIFILLILIVQTTLAQKWIRLGMFASSIVLNASGDALNNTGHKQGGHLLNTMSIATLLTIPLVTDVDKKKWVAYLGCYSLMRYGIFDCTYNLTAGQPIFFNGSTSSLDKLTGHLPPEAVMFSRALALIFSIQINFTKL